MKKLSLIVFPLLCAMLSGCGTPKTVTRINTNTQTDLSGRWNDTDSRLVAEEMIHSLTTRSWIGNYIDENKKKPTLIVGSIRNLSTEHIATTGFIKDIERSLINSGMVRFVASKEERQEVRDERSDQQTNASQETIKRMAQESGADFMLQGSITTQNDASEGVEARFYQVDLELVNLETNEKIWLDSKKIKKIIEKKSAEW